MPTQNNLTSANGENIVLLHGILATSKYWNRVTKRLRRQGFRVITPDLLGFGKSTSAPATNYTYDEHIEHIHQYILKLDLPEPFILVGHSMGALLATRYSLQYPAKVKKLFLFNPPLYLDSEQARATLRDTNWLYRFLLDSKYRNAGWILLKKIPSNLIENHLTAARELSLRNIIESAEFVDDLEKVKTKTVLMIGKNDRPIYQENLLVIQVPGDVRVLIENVPHHSPILRPNLVARIISGEN